MRFKSTSCTCADADVFSDDFIERTVWNLAGEDLSHFPIFLRNTQLTCYSNTSIFIHADIVS